ncbi:energy transducer TonB [Methylococcus sp. EFPC2]|uniref:energy transducer TonB n=1 Tax=Methylococcus sp. EFPC2 TaxID=2812648 RepID=UPI0019682AA0|nr:energy transducer TonB [Methylococcus sp. EFPC2]QSA98644.1 energy transducer TonB [Methylococcus sp. EFPC2]
MPVPLGAGMLPNSWRRTLGVASAALVAATLHGLVFLWYMNRPAPVPLIAAAPLPMIDIALAAPASPQVVQPAPTPPEPPKPEKKPDPAPVKKAKPKPKPVPKEPVAKRAEVQEEVRETAPPTPAPPAPVKAEAASPHNEVYTPASSTADYLNNPRPVYPSIARSRHWEGLVLLRVYVSPDGHAMEVNVQRSSGHEVLDESALEAVRKWKFVPAKRGDVAQASWVTVPIEFELR